MHYNDQLSAGVTFGVAVLDDQVEILGQTDDGTHFVVLNKRTNQQGECPIDIIDICEYSLYCNRFYTVL